jgi:hypothetical protein
VESSSAGTTLLEPTREQREIQKVVTLQQSSRLPRGPLTITENSMHVWTIVRHGARLAKRDMLSPCLNLCAYQSFISSSSLFSASNLTICNMLVPNNSTPWTCHAASTDNRHYKVVYERQYYVLHIQYSHPGSARLSMHMYGMYPLFTLPDGSDVLLGPDASPTLIRAQLTCQKEVIDVALTITSQQELAA